MYQEGDFLKLRKEVRTMKGKLLAIAVKKGVAVCTIGLVVLFSGSHASAADIVTNGSFEDPDIDSESIIISAAISGWSLAFGCGIEVQDHVAGTPDTGDQHVELDSNCSSGMYQDLPTTSGQLYDLSFAYSPRPGVSNNHILVKWDGAVIADLNANGVGLADTAWEVHDITCLSADSMDETRRLQFEDASVSDTFGGYIDSVSVEEHPDSGCVSTTADVDDSASVDTRAVIEPGAVVEERAAIDSGVWIAAEAVIEADAAISRDTMIEAEAVVGERTMVDKETDVGEAAVIGSDSAIATEARVGAETSIGDAVIVDREAMMGEECVVEDHVVIGRKLVMEDQATIERDARIGQAVTIGARATIGEGSRIGAYSMIGECATIAPGTNIKRGTIVPSGVCPE